jgi:light-independent protochlorophyllide reductase subunit B
MLVGASCTAELIQDDPGGLAKALALPIPVVPLELPAYQRKENWGAAETFYQLVRALAGPARAARARRAARRGSARARCNLLGPPRSAFAIATTCARSRAARALGDRRQRDRAAGRSAADIARLGEADFNVVLYPEIASQAAPG